jgi:hypothetical protein
MFGSSFSSISSILIRELPQIPTAATFPDPHTLFRSRCLSNSFLLLFFFFFTLLL